MRKESDEDYIAEDEGKIISIKDQPMIIKIIIKQKREGL